MPDPKIDPDAAAAYFRREIQLAEGLPEHRRDHESLNCALFAEALVEAARAAVKALETCAQEHIYPVANGNMSCAICEGEHPDWKSIEHTRATPSGEECLTGQATRAFLILEALLPTAEKE